MGMLGPQALNRLEIGGAAQGTNTFNLTALVHEIETKVDIPVISTRGNIIMELLVIVDNNSTGYVSWYGKYPKGEARKSMQVPLYS